MRIALLPPTGLNSNDTIFAAPGTWESGSNVRFFQGKPQALGKERVASTGFSNVRKMLAYNISGTPSLALAGTANLYRLNLNTNASTDITPASNWASSRAYSLDMFGDILLASPMDGRLFRSTAGAQAVEIANAPDNIVKMIVTPSRQVMALGCNEEVSATFNRRCIRWCDIEDYDDWTTTSSNNAGEYILPGQEDIVTGCVLGRFIVIWTTGSIWLGQYLGDPGQTYLFERIDGIGCASHGSYAIYKGVVYWMDASLSVWQYAPGATPARIPCQISNELIGIR
jgi:hypothetical protein